MIRSTFGDHLGDRMLHLNARVHFNEVEGAVLVAQEFHGTGVGIPHLPQRLDYAASEVGARLFVHHRRGRFLNELLVAALDAAFPFAEVNHVAVLITEHLEFDVPGTLDVFFEVYIRRAKGLLCLVARGFECVEPIRFVCERRACLARRRPAEAFTMSG